MNKMRKIQGGVCAAEGFVAGATGCGIKNGKATRDDLAVVFSETAATAAATFTTNKVKAAPVRISSEHLRAGRVRAVVLNSGNANSCTGATGLADARAMASATAKSLALKSSQVLVCSTGRIGVPMPVLEILKGIPSVKLTRAGSGKAAKAIMTSDTFSKEIALEVTTHDGRFRIGGLAKGAGMIDPNMATMLCVVTTDAIVPADALRKALRDSVEDSFNRITIDGDMSTNDTVILLANGASGISPSPAIFRSALDVVTRALARMIVEDGEGVSRFVEVEVRRAANRADARKAAEAIANSTLVKCAWAGGDPNWGRILDAVGYSGARIKETATDIFYDALPVAVNGVAAKTPVNKLRRIAAKKAFRVTVDLKLGKATHVVWTTDLTEEYVRFNLGE
ncbi:MAG: bifunctional glutamate N-acetyltransferase/amino-acid acetyltransferase ArgJ [Terrimicrobiaceae bacterium]|jgi:glutamate N-acetyltransferase/amino-acid N-acetyltransferase|nr:bifunctional glutamate N-acetyltransferase/amino-acid acetyltransferase ArgJ [Terrimicrobiaceae bacterium]